MCHLNCICQTLNIILKIEIKAFIYMAKVTSGLGCVFLLAFSVYMSSTRICV